MSFRYKRKRVPKQTITAEEWEKIKEEAETARALMEDPEFEFLRTYLKNAQQSIVDKFVQNKIKKVSENVITQFVNRTLHITKEEQEHELSGQYNFIDKFFTDLELTSKLPEKFKEAQAAGEVDIESDAEGVHES